MKKELIGLAGEMRVCAELIKKGHSASITHGNAKATDIIILGPSNRFIRVEVKTSKNGKNFVTGFFPKYTDSVNLRPDLWVFCLPDSTLSSHGDRFFLATHQEVEMVQLVVNKGNKTEKGQGCDNIPLKELIKHDFENKWDIVDELLSNPINPDYFRNRTANAFKKSAFNLIDGWVHFRHISGRLASNTPGGLLADPLILNDKKNGSVVSFSNHTELIDTGWTMV